MDEWVRDTVSQHLCAGGRPLPRPAQPLALSRQDLPRLAEGYYVCEKTDGTWVRLLADGRGGAWGVTRRDRVQTLENAPVVAGGVTLVEAELLPGGIRVFDAFWVGGRDVRHLPLPERLGCAATAGLETKRMRPLAGLPRLLERLAAAPGGEWRMDNGDPVDGLIFTPITGGHGPVLKWKMHNTLDLTVDDSGAVGCKGPGGFLPLGFTASAPPGVHEFRLGAEGWWVPVRPRPDKADPNYVKVVFHTLEVMGQRVGLDDVNAAASSS